MKLLLIEDDALLANGLIRGLRETGLGSLRWVQNGREAIQTILNEDELFDLIILDIGLPELSGLEILKRMRKENISTPVLILTSLDQIRDIVAGLDSGADDYLVKPFDLDELCARIRALQRRNDGKVTPLVQYKNITLDPAGRTVYKDNTEVELSRREFVLLHILLANPGKVLTRDHLTKSLYGWKDDVDSNALEVHIHNLRKKFGNELIATVRGVGYVVEKIK